MRLAAEQVSDAHDRVPYSGAARQPQQRVPTEKPTKNRGAQVMGHRRTTAVAALLGCLLALGGCATSSGGGSSGGATTHGSPSGSAADFLPNTANWPFTVTDADLAKGADALDRAVKLVQRAMKDSTAPRDATFGAEEAASAADRFAARFAVSVYLAATAVKCLYEHGHLALHSYVDTGHYYSVAVVLVLDVKAYTDAKVAWCAVRGLLPHVAAAPLSTAPPTAPSLSPCVGLRREGRYVIAWLASTDWMCAALHREDGKDVKDVQADRGRLRLQATEPTEPTPRTDVAYLQVLLDRVGFNLAVDGVFGPATNSALRRFQGCVPDSVGPDGVGVADDETIKALEAQTWSVDQCPP